MNLLPATIAIPHRRFPFVERSFLGEITGKVAESRVTLIAAPAGSGKTSAASYWLEKITASGRPGLWLACRAGIGDLRTFLMALKEAGVRAGLPWSAFDPATSAADCLPLLSSYGERRPVIVIDDANLLNAEVLDFLERLIVGARDAITIIISSRGEVQIPVSRMRSLGFLVEVGLADLAFEDDEATQLITSIVGSPRNAAAALALANDMEGWVAGLVIVAEYFRRQRGSLDLARAVEEGLNSYFQEEILRKLDPRMREFVTATSVLDKVTFASCAAVMDDEEAGVLLERTCKEGLFLSKRYDESNSFRYNPRFREVIHASAVNLSASSIATYERRASEYFAGQGETQLAITHAHRSNDQDFLANQLDRLANTMIDNGELFMIDQMASGLPWEVIARRPMLLLALAWRKTRRLSLAAAERCIVAAEEIAAAKPDDHALAYVLRHRRLLLEGARDNLRVVKADAEDLLIELGDEEPYLSCTLVALLMLARRELFQFHDILKLEAETRRALERPGSEFPSIALKATVAPTLAAHGKTCIAQRYLEEALELAERRCGVGSSVAAVPALPLAELLYESGELNRAEELLDQYLPTIRQWGLVDEVAAGFITRARITFAKGDITQALAGLEEAHLIAIECGLDRLRAFVVAEQVRILVRSGQVAAAEEAMRVGNIIVESPPVPTKTPTRKLEYIAIAWLRIEIQRQRLSNAKKVAARWLEFVKRCSAKRSIAVFQLLLAEIAVLEGDRTRAQRCLREAIEIAEPAGWVRLFLDEGDIVCSLLSEGYAHQSCVESPTDSFAHQIVAIADSPRQPFIASDAEPQMGPGSSLAERETEILALVYGGLRNREIGIRLGLTEGTVKWYLQQIYDKLGVRRRSQAVLRARQFGLIG